MNSESFFADYFATEGNDFSLCYPKGMKAKLIRKEDEGDPFLKCRITYKGKTDEVTFFDTFKLGKLCVLEDREPGKVDTSLASGEIGERLMRAAVYMMLNHMRDKNPDFDYKILVGKPKTKLLIKEHIELVYGPIGNVWIYRRRQKTVAKGKRIKEFRAKHVSDIDTLVEFSYKGKPGLLVCEAKTSEIDWKELYDEAKDNQLEYLRKVLFPDYEIIYLLMAQKDRLIDKNHPTGYNNDVRVFQFNMRSDTRGVESMFFPFPEGVSQEDMEDDGEYVAELVKAEVKDGIPVTGRYYPANAIKLRNSSTGKKSISLEVISPNNYTKEQVLDDFCHNRLWKRKKEELPFPAAKDSAQQQEEQDKGPGLNKGIS